MQHLTAQQLHDLRTRLEQEKSALMRQRQQEATDAVAAAEQHQPDVGDRQDAAATEAAQLAQWTLADHERARVDEIDAALQRMTDGSYGICELSDEPIPHGRLAAEPTARTTVEAQEDEERERSREKPDAGARRRAY